MRTSFRHILPLLLLVAAGCEETIDIEIEDQEPLLVLNAQLSSDRTQHTVFLSLSTVSNVTAVKGADVKVSINGAAPVKAVEQAEKTDEWNYRSYTGYLFEAELHPGDKVQLTASKDSRSASCEVTLPPRINLMSADTSRVQVRTYENYTEESFQLKVDFQDPEEENYYRFSCVLESDVITTMKGGETFLHPQHRTLRLDTSNDPVISEGLSTGSDNALSFFKVDNSYAVFSDELFRGSRRTFRFSISPYALEDLIFPAVSADDPDWDWDQVSLIRSTHRRLGVMLYSLDYVTYRYLKSLNNMETFGYEQQILIEPTTLPSNVEGGTGFVGAYTASEIIWFDLPDILTPIDQEEEEPGQPEGTENEGYTYED